MIQVLQSTSRAFLAAHPSASRLLSPHQGKCILMTNTSLHRTYIAKIADDATLQWSLGDADTTPDLSFTGRTTDWVSYGLALSQGRITSTQSLQIEGDIGLSHDLVQLLSEKRDWLVLIEPFLGDVGVGIVQNACAMMRDVFGTRASPFTNWQTRLQDDWALVPTASAVQTAARQTRDLHYELDRIEKRLERLTEQEVQA